MKCPICNTELCSKSRWCRYGKHCNFHHLSHHKKKALKEYYSKLKLQMDIYELKEEIMKPSRDLAIKQSRTLDAMVDVVAVLEPVDASLQWNLLEKKLLIDTKDELKGSISSTLQRMIYWKEENNPEDQQGIWELLETKMQLEKKRQHKKNQARLLMRMISWVKENLPAEIERHWELYENLLKLEKEKDDLKGQSMAYDMMYNWVKDNDSENTQKLKQILSKMLAIERKANNVRGESMVLIEMIEWAKSHKPETVWGWLEQKLIVDEKEKSPKSKGMTLRMMYNWTKINNPENIELLGDLLEQMLETCDDEEDGNYLGQSYIIQEQIIWVKENQPDDIELHWKLLEEQLEIHTHRGSLDFQAMTIIEMIKWLENNSPWETKKIWKLLETVLKINEECGDYPRMSHTLRRMVNWIKENEEGDIQRLWKLLEKKLEINMHSKNMLGVSITLRNMAYLSKSNEGLSFPKELLHQIGSGAVSKYEYLQYLITCMIADVNPGKNLEFPNSESFIEELCNLIINCILTKATEYTSSDHRTMIRRMNVDALEQSLSSNSEFVSSGEMIFDLPNILHLSRNSHVEIPKATESLIQLLNSEPRNNYIHLSIDSIIDFSFSIEEIHLQTDAILIFHISELPEDIGMINYAISNGLNIISNDQFRDIIRDFPALSIFNFDIIRTDFSWIDNKFKLIE